MSSRSTTPATDRSVWIRFWPALVLVGAGVAAYANSLATPFLFDDWFAIQNNPTIRSLWPLSRVLSPPVDGSAVVGRPLVNLSFALNYAVGGLDVVGYHVFNLVIHLLAGLLLFGILRRTLPRPPLAARFATAATPLALTAALLWLLHPLQTESVTAIVQRTESLMGLFFLATFYAFIRSAAAPTSRVWPILAFAACLAGMATKEVMVVVPVLLLLYDRTFLAGGFRAAWRERSRLYLALASTWILLGWLVLSTGASRGGTSGIGSGVTSGSYLLTQARAIAGYLGLAFWPHPLVLDYGMRLDHSVAAVAPQGILILLLLAATGIALRRWPAWGFAGAWFFLILAPSSSVVPLASQTMAEHRMYLPLAAVLVPLVLVVYRWGGRRTALLGAGAALAVGSLTVDRNADYRSAVSIWEDTVKHQPDNGRAHHNLGQAYYLAGRLPEAQTELEAALALEPTVETEALLGIVDDGLGQPSEALVHAQEAVRLDPTDAASRLSLGNILIGMGRTSEAIDAFQEAARLDATSTDARLRLGTTLAQNGRWEEAESAFKAALAIDPDDPVAYCDLGNVSFQRNQLDDAAAEYQRAIEIRPDYLEARYNLALVRTNQGRNDDAIAQLRRVLELNPDFAEARSLLAELDPGVTLPAR